MKNLKIGLAQAQLRVSRSKEIHVFSSVLCQILISEERKNVRFVFTVICFVGDQCFIYVICVYIRILVSNIISPSDDVRLTITRRVPLME